MSPADRIEALEQRLRRTQLALSALAAAGLGLLALSGARVDAQSAPSDGVLHARGLVIHDANGVDRIYIGAPVPSGPGEKGDRVSPATGMILLDANRRERFGLGLMDNGWLTMGFDAAPGAGAGANRERLHLGVTPEGQGYIRFLDRNSALAGYLNLTDDDKLALELWNRQGPRFTRGVVDVDGWRKLPDYAVPTAK